MAHEKVFGFCENLCNVEVPAKENIYNENMLINCDDLQNNSVGARYNVQSTIKPNVELNSMACTGWGATPNPQGGHSNSGSLKMKYRESAISGHGDFDPVLPVTLQVRFYNDQTGEFKDRVMVFESLADSSSQYFNLDADPAGGIPNPIRLTFRISLTNNEVVITWSTNAAFSSMYTVSIVGAKLERGTSPSTFEVGNGLSTGNLMLNLASDVAKFGIENHQINSLTTSEKTIPLAINQLNSEKISNDSAAMIWKHPSQSGYYSMSGTFASISSWITSNYETNRWVYARVNPTDSSGYFGTSGFSIMANLSSANYGWAVLFSDNKNKAPMVIGQWNAPNWKWQAMSGTVVTD